MGVSLCRFNIFGVRTVFSMDACHLFPQCVLVVIPLTGSVQIWQLFRGPEVPRGKGGSDTTLKVVPDLFWRL